MVSRIGDDEMCILFSQLLSSPPPPPLHRLPMGGTMGEGGEGRGREGGRVRYTLRPVGYLASRARQRGSVMVV